MLRHCIVTYEYDCFTEFSTDRLEKVESCVMVPKEHICNGTASHRETPNKPSKFRIAFGSEFEISAENT